MAKIYYQEDCNLSLLEGKTIAVIGYGSQGHAQALNAKESGCHVIIGLYEGSKSWARAEAQGFEVYTAAEAAKRADIIMILINDELQAAMYKKDIEPNLEEGNMLMFSHGFNIHFNQIVPPKNVGRSSGCHRKGSGVRAGIWPGYRRSESRNPGDYLPHRDRDRPVRRAGSALRRRMRSDAGRLRYAGRGRLRPEKRLLRVRA